jgi:hypothetical protein
MPDTFVQSFNQGFNVAHQIENDKRVADFQKVQMAQLAQNMMMQKAQFDQQQQAYADQQAFKKSLLPTTQTITEQVPDTSKPKTQMQPQMSQFEQGQQAQAGYATPQEYQKQVPTGEFETKPVQKQVQVASPVVEMVRKRYGDLAATELMRTGDLKSVQGFADKYMSVPQGGSVYDTSTGKVVYAGTPKEKSSQLEGVTERGGLPVAFRPGTEQLVVTNKDGSKVPYDATQHGKLLSKTMNQTTIYNQGKKEAEGFKSWTPDAKEQEFMLHMMTGKPPVSASGMGGNDRQAYAKAYAQWKVDKGIRPQDIALMQADYRAGDMALKNMKKQEAPMSAFVGNINKQIEKVKQLYDNNDRIGLRLLDLPLRELKVRAMGSGDEAVKASYLLEISNEIGKLSSGASASVQQLSDSAKEDWKKVHDVNLPMKEIMKIVNATRDQANMRLGTWKEAGEAVRNQIRFMGTGDSGGTSSPAQDYDYEYKNGKLIKVK